LKISQLFWMHQFLPRESFSAQRQTIGTGVMLVAFETHFAYTCNLSSLPQGQLDNTASISRSEQFLDNGALLAAESTH
jgi:hypothetical protein